MAKTKIKTYVVIAADGFGTADAWHDAGEHLKLTDKAADPLLSQNLISEFVPIPQNSTESVVKSEPPLEDEFRPPNYKDVMAALKKKKRTKEKSDGN